jgi:hypothetical protein
MSFHGSWLFSLVPISTEASRILYQNPKYAVRLNGIESLSFRTSHRSRIPGHLVSFGSNVDSSDVLLDKHSPSCVLCPQLTAIYFAD